MLSGDGLSAHVLKTCDILAQLKSYESKQPYRQPEE
jgi:hypothetical protein